MVEFRILGPLEASAGGRSIPLGGTRQRALVAALVLRRNTPVSGDQLVEELWDGRPPATAAKIVQVYVSRFRGALADAGEEPARLATGPAGYVLAVADDELDLARFERLVAAGRRALAQGAPRTASQHLHEALALWRGDALADVRYESFAAAEAARLEELRVAALEDRIEADLALGRHEVVVPELERLAAEHPLRERLRGQLMLALYRAGRQADALAAYRAGRDALDALGLDPGRPLRDLETAILRQDDALGLARGAPPAVSLPVPLTRLIGRDAELAELAALLDGAGVRLVTVTGPGGTGKTSLALAAAHAVAERFEHGAAFVDLAALTDPVLVLPAVAAAVGARQEGPEALAEALTAMLAERRLLLVLDNFEHVAAASADVVRVLRGAPGVVALVTSRAPLRVAGEREYPVGPLPVGADDGDRGAAVQLFAERAGAVRPGFALDGAAAATVAEICRRLEGLPLAIELAAAQARLLAPADILDRLERRLALGMEGPRDLPERQRSLRATIDWSRRLLDEGDGRRFACLAAFAGGFDAAAAAAVWEADEDEALRSLGALLDAGLIVAGHGGDHARFRLLETIRAYAAEGLAAAGEDGAIDRHTRHFRALAETSERELTGSAQDAWVARLGADAENLRAALDRSLAADPESAARIAAALTRFWGIAGWLSEARLWLDRVLAQSEGIGLGARARALNARARVAGWQADWDGSERFSRAALEAARDAGDVDSLATAHSSLGWAAISRGEVAAGAADLERALELARGGTDAAQVSSCLNDLAGARFFAGDLAGAAALLAESRDLCARRGDLRSVATATTNLGEVALAAGDLARAGEHAHESLALLERLGDPLNASAALNVLARAALVGGDLAAARDHLERSARLLGESGGPAAAADVVEALAAVSTRVGDHEVAAALYGSAQALRDGAGAALADPILAPLHEPDVAAVRAALGDARFAEAWARGGALDLEAAIALGRAAAPS